MKSVTKYGYNDLGQVKMAQIDLNSEHWLRLLGDRNQVNGSASFGKNGHQVGGPVPAAPVMMSDYRADHWLRLLGETGQPDHSTRNGRPATIAPQTWGNQQFTPEHWLRLLGDAR